MQNTPRNNLPSRVCWIMRRNIFLKYFLFPYFLPIKKPRILGAFICYEVQLFTHYHSHGFQFTILQ
jgi:hypothetical protein